MNTIEGRFQYFYCTHSLTSLPHSDVPTRDVTNTRGAGCKTEPNLEKKLENWCRCRALFITAAAKRGRWIANQGGQHYLLLTTRHPHDHRPFVVGVMPFSEQRYSRLLRQYPGRWSEKDYLPYPSDEQMKLVSFGDAFPLSHWMQKENIRSIPGGQGGRGRVPETLLLKILMHFSKLPDQSYEFIKNVKTLEKRLKQFDPVMWREYKSRLPNQRCC